MNIIEDNGTRRLFTYDGGSIAVHSHYIVDYGKNYINTDFISPDEPANIKAYFLAVFGDSVSDYLSNNNNIEILKEYIIKLFKDSKHHSFYVHDIFEVQNGVIVPTAYAETYSNSHNLVDFNSIKKMNRLSDVLVKYYHWDKAVASKYKNVLAIRRQDDEFPLLQFMEVESFGSDTSLPNFEFSLPKIARYYLHAYIDDYVKLCDDYSSLYTVIRNECWDAFKYYVEQCFITNVGREYADEDELDEGEEYIDLAKGAGLNAEDAFESFQDKCELMLSPETEGTMGLVVGKKYI